MLQIYRKVQTSWIYYRYAHIHILPYFYRSLFNFYYEIFATLKAVYINYVAHTYKMKTQELPPL